MAASNMHELLEQLEKHFSTTENVGAELLPPASNDELDVVERELGITLPEYFRQLYQWHNGNRGDLFLFGEFRLVPLNQLLELYSAAHHSSDDDWYKVSDDSGIFKDCLAHRKWIQFADNGGNTIVLFDLDRGKTGTAGQLLEACDGEPECRFNGIREFVADLNKRIANGELARDAEAGTFQDTDGESVAERQRFDDKMKLLEASPSFEQLQKLETGNEVTLAGGIKPNHKTGVHKFYLRGGAIKVNGDIGEIHTTYLTGPALVQIKVKAGKKSLFGLGSPAYEVISCERVPQ
jgi:cell wall assembly regulator SMI1